MVSVGADMVDPVKLTAKASENQWLVGSDSFPFGDIPLPIFRGPPTLKFLRFWGFITKTQRKCSYFDKGLYRLHLSK